MVRYLPFLYASDTDCPLLHSGVYPGAELPMLLFVGRNKASGKKGSVWLLGRRRRRMGMARKYNRLVGEIAGMRMRMRMSTMKKRVWL